MVMELLMSVMLLTSVFQLRQELFMVLAGSLIIRIGNLVLPFKVQVNVPSLWTRLK